jgi:hypothetical protein
VRSTNPREKLRLGNFFYSCPDYIDPRGDYYRAEGVGFIGTVLQSQGKSVKEIASPTPNGFNYSSGSNFCNYERVTFSDIKLVDFKAQTFGQVTWQQTRTLNFFDYGSGEYIDVIYKEAWTVSGFIRQVKRVDGKCDRVSFRGSCVTQTNFEPNRTPQTTTGTSCPIPYPTLSEIVDCKAEPDSDDYEELWSPSPSRYLTQPDNGSDVKVEPVSPVM